MLPKSVSATALTTAKLCRARYKAENIEYARGWGSPAGLLGSTIHSALEDYVGEVYVDGKHGPSPRALESLFEIHFLKNFGVEGDPKLKEAGLEMCERWSAKEEFHMAGRKVLTREVKEHIFIETPHGTIKLNYILDRFDEIGPDEYEIIDYKSSFFNETVDSLMRLLQPKIYALAMFIKYPNAKKMLVTFDMLRYKPVTVEITKDEARSAFQEIYDIVQMILDTPDDAPYEDLEQINKSCNFCIRKANCKALQKNIEVGGLYSLDLQGQIDLRTEIELKVKGLKALQDELEGVIEESMGKELMTELPTGRSRAFFTVPATNKITSLDTARKIVGDEVFFTYGETKMTLAQFDKMCKDPNISDDQREQLKGLKSKEFGDPRLKFENTRTDEQKAAIAPDLTGQLTAAAPAAPILGLED